MSTRLRAACLAVAVLAAGCGSGGGDTAPNATDRAFLAQMIPHHERAIEVARLGTTAATDPRVRRFAARIVREQSPELARMRTAAAGLSLDLVAGARTAEHRITDTQLTTLDGLRGTAYDRAFVRLHIESETGAAAMAKDELRAGDDSDAQDIARPIATAPTTQIPELRHLLVNLG